MAKVKAKTKRNTQLSKLVRSIGEIIGGRNELARQTEKQCTMEVENIMLTQSHDVRRIHRVLDGILDFCFDPAMLGLYKKLCRYYYGIDPVATASYVYAYRDMWDEGGANLSKPKRKFYEENKNYQRPAKVHQKKRRAKP